MIRCAGLLQIRWPLALRAGNANAAWSERSALILVLRDDAGRVGLGEAAPLPGFSPDTLDDAARSLEPLVGHALGGAVPGAEPLARLAAAMPSPLSPAARHAVETALLDLWSRQVGIPAWQMLSMGGAQPATIPTACLLPPDPAAALERARGAFEAGCRTFKVKLRPRELGADLALLRALRSGFGNAAALRADGNQALTRELLDPFAADLRAAALEWLEEPWPDAARSSWEDVPIALDESLSGTTDFAVAQKHGVRALVLKPSLLGGLVSTRALAAGATALGWSAVISHQFEGPVGFQSAAALALSLPAAGPAHGLGPHDALAAFGCPVALMPQAFALRRYSEPGLGVDLDCMRPFIQRVAGELP